MAKIKGQNTSNEWTTIVIFLTCHIHLTVSNVIFFCNIEKKMYTSVDIKGTSISQGEFSRIYISVMLSSYLDYTTEYLF